MALVAIRQSDGVEIESFSVPSDEWKAMKKEPLGHYLIAQTGWPAVLKTSIRGLQHFAHAPGYKGEKPKPESPAHLLSKATIANALRAAGFSVSVEQSGVCPNGEKWQADVLCHTSSRTIVFEVQLANQTLTEYEERTARYARCGMKCIWLVKRYKGFAKAVCHRLGNPDWINGKRPGLAHVPALPFFIGDNRQPTIDDLQVMVFRSDGFEQIPLAEFAIGVANGCLLYSNRQWLWRAPTI